MIASLRPALAPLRLACAALAALFLVACGESEEPAPPKSPPARRPMPAQPPPDVDAKMGEGTMPEGLAGDVPLFPGVEPSKWISAGGMGTIATFRTDEPPQAVFDFYLRELPERGWAIETQMSRQGNWMLAADKSGRKVRVSIARRGEQSEVGLAVSEAP